MNHNRRSSLRPMSQINVVPYIDVMLVLLVIFMITAPLLTPGQVDLPSVGKAQVPSIAPLEVVIKKNATLAMRDRSMGSRELPVSRNELLAYLKERHGKKADQPVVISADKDVRYEEVINVMEMLRKQQIQKVGLLVQVKGDE